MPKINYRGQPRVDRKNFPRLQHNSTVKILGSNIFQLYVTVEQCRIALNDVGFFQLMLSIIEFSKNVKYYRLIPGIVEYC